jgi:uncharacterized protein
MHTTAELDHLAELLHSLPYQNDGMILNQFDGYCAGLIVCPEMVMPTEWLAIVWGDNAESVFEDTNQAQIIIDAVVGHYNRVVNVLEIKPDQYDVVFCIEQNNDGLLWRQWIDGFERAMRLRPNVWKQIIESDDDEAASSVGMIIAMNDINHGQSKLDDAAIDYIDDIAPELIPKLVLFLNAWTKGWLSSGLPVEPHINPKTGNNVVRFH